MSHLTDDARDHYDKDPTALTDAGWLARSRGDFDEASSLAAELRRGYPGHAAGYQIGALAARDRRRFDEHREIIELARERFFDEAWPLIEAGWAARSRGDFEEASRSADELRRRFPSDLSGYQIGALAARDLSRWDEESEIVVQAKARFPSEPWLLEDAGWAARARGESARAIELAAELRARFPGSVSGYQIGALVLRELGWFSAAALIATEARSRFHEQAWPLQEVGWGALSRGDNVEALAEAAELRRRFPVELSGYQIGAAAARAMGRFGDAAEIVQDAITRFPEERWASEELERLRAAAPLGEREGRSTQVDGDDAELRSEHLEGARIFANRRDLMRALTVPANATIAEIGVARGDFSEFLIGLFKPAKFIAIDLFEMDKQPEHWGIKQEVLFSGMTHLDFYTRRFRPLGDRVDVLRGYSHDRMLEIPDGSCDVIYVDANHGYESVAREAEIAMRKLTPGGVIVFNDYTHFDQFLKSEYGVVRAVNELINRHDLRVLGFALEKNMFCDIAVARRGIDRP